MNKQKEIRIEEEKIRIEVERNYHNIHNFLLATIVRAFVRICNPTALNISIYNALMCEDWKS